MHGQLVMHHYLPASPTITLSAVVWLPLCVVAVSAPLLCANVSVMQLVTCMVTYDDVYSPDEAIYGTSVFTFLV